MSSLAAFLRAHRSVAAVAALGITAASSVSAYALTPTKTAAPSFSVGTALATKRAAAGSAAVAAPPVLGGGPVAVGGSPSTSSSATASASATADPTAWPALVLAAPKVPGTLSLTYPKQGQAIITLAEHGTMGGYGPVNSSQPIASVAKTMTAYVILHDHPLTPGSQGPGITVTAADVTAYKYDVSQDMSVVKVTAGEVITENQALQALMIASADNMADILGAWDAGSDSAFVAKMNSAAVLLGMTHTTYKDASGYDPGTISTATDQMLLAQGATEDPYFSQLVAEKSAVIPVAGTITNYNSLLGTDGIDGIKTGSTSQAGGCLLFSATVTVGGQRVELVGNVLGQDAPSGTELGVGLTAAKNLVASAEKQLTTYTVATPQTLVATQPVAGGGTRNLYPVGTLTVAAWPGETLTLRLAGNERVPALQVVDGSFVVAQVSLV